MAVVLWRYYVWENARRDRGQEGREGIQGVSDEMAWVGLTDKENRRFRYVY